MASLPLYLIGSWFWTTVSLPFHSCFQPQNWHFAFQAASSTGTSGGASAVSTWRYSLNQGIPKGVSPNSSVKLLQTRASVFCWYQCFMRTLPLVGLWWWSASVWNIHNDHHLLSCFSCVSLQVHHLDGIGYQTIHHENGITTSIYPSLHRLHVSRTSDSESRRSDASVIVAGAPMKGWFSFPLECLPSLPVSFSELKTAILFQVDWNQNCTSSFWKKRNMNRNPKVWIFHYLPLFYCT